MQPGPLHGAHQTPLVFPALFALQVFPGQGPPDATLTFTGGLTNVTAQLGLYLDNFLGAGGSGPTVVRRSCQRSGPKGIDRAAAPAPVPAAAPALSFHCSVECLPCAGALHLYTAGPGGDWVPGGLGALARAARHQHRHRRPSVLLRAWRLPGRCARGLSTRGQSLTTTITAAAATITCTLTTAAPATANTHAFTTAAITCTLTLATAASGAVATTCPFPTAATAPATSTSALTTPITGLVATTFALTTASGGAFTTATTPGALAATPGTLAAAPGARAARRDAGLVAVAGPVDTSEHHGHLPLPRLHPGVRLLLAAGCVECNAASAAQAAAVLKLTVPNCASLL